MRQEKELLLKEEAAATQAALDAMKKAHETELKREREKFVAQLSLTYSHADIQDMQKKHEEEIAFIQSELMKLSEQFTVKCIEHATLVERMKAQTSLLHQCRHRVQELIERNEELTSHLKQEVELMNKKLNNCYSGDQNFKEIVKHLQQSELMQVREALFSTQLKLQIKNDELKELGDKYNQLYAVVCRSKQSNNGIHSGSGDSSIGGSCGGWSSSSGRGGAYLSRESLAELSAEAVSTADDKDLIFDWSFPNATSRLIDPKELPKDSLSNPMMTRKTSWKFKNKSKLSSQKKDINIANNNSNESSNNSNNNNKNSNNDNNNNYDNDVRSRRLFLEKSKSVDSDHSILSTFIPDGVSDDDVSSASHNSHNNVKNNKNNNNDSNNNNNNVSGVDDFNEVVNLTNVDCQIIGKSKNEDDIDGDENDDGDDGKETGGYDEHIGKNLIDFSDMESKFHVGKHGSKSYIHPRNVYGVSNNNDDDDMKHHVILILLIISKKYVNELEKIILCLL
ncbi:hypothetical protein HELRODRAFT_192390 [Helobdella robusta]|uniref:Uncharacterized protein n=1 Tax=Helobdella robusta TaxID=6412 RepID=T1FTW3_HELRO|nr:hypothetical protein HELRODRAFT_192390 [Helobdella robusta]ESO01154.1 hypothetical protein HELRODRAFT_192390 [Helobdella robusta]